MERPKEQPAAGPTARDAEALADFVEELLLTETLHPEISPELVAEARRLIKPWGREG